MNTDDFGSRVSRTKGRQATEGVIPGRLALSVGMPALPAPAQWRWVPLSDVAQLESGHTPSRRHPEYWDGGVPWIGIKDAVDNHGRTIFHTYQHVSDMGLANSSARLLPERTVCLSRTASVGYVVVMGRSMATSQDFVNWVCGPSLEPDYLKYVLVAERDSLLRFASGTTHQTIYYPEAKAFHALLPPLDVQRRILGILCALDDKIELNRQTNETLEAMARALFKSWFVDFDPVHAKAEGRTPSGMDAETAQMFPGKFDEAETGKLPKGWWYTTVGNIVKQYGGDVRTGPFGTALQASEYCTMGDPGVPVIAVRDIRTGYLATDVRTPRVPPSVAERLSVFRVLTGDILFGRKGAVERYAAVGDGESGWLMGSDCIRLRLDTNHAELLRHLFSMPQHRDWMIQNATGTTMPSLNQGIIERIPLVHPGPEVVSAFAQRVSPLDRLIRQRADESDTLSKARDALLPRLLSGELPIRHAERFVEAHL